MHTNSPTPWSLTLSTPVQCLDPPRIVTEFYPKGSLFSIIERARCATVCAA